MFITSILKIPSTVSLEGTGEKKTVSMTSLPRHPVLFQENCACAAVKESIGRPSVTATAAERNRQRAELGDPGSTNHLL